ncbi:MAG: hypothetical protein RR415_08745 [Ruthenibacterium sp.]
MGIKHLSGTPWHVGFLKMSDGDERRHKARCIYHTKENKCTRNNIDCIGSAHCTHYIENTNNLETVKKPAEREETRNQSIVLYSNSDKSRIELFMNGLEYKKLPKLHQVAFTKSISEKFEFNGESYRVLSKYENKTYKNSYKIMQEKEPKNNVVNVINTGKGPTIKEGDKVTLYSVTYEDVIEFPIGKNYNVSLEKACIGKSINEKFSCNGENFSVQYFESKKQ